MAAIAPLGWIEMPLFGQSVRRGTSAYHPTNEKAPPASAKSAIIGRAICDRRRPVIISAIDEASGVFIFRQWLCEEVEGRRGLFAFVDLASGSGADLRRIAEVSHTTPPVAKARAAVG